MKKLAIGIALFASIIGLGASVPASAQTIDLGQMRQLIELFIAIGVISPAKADAARLMVGLPISVAIQTVSTSSVDQISSTTNTSSGNSQSVVQSSNSQTIMTTPVQDNSPVASLNSVNSDSDYENKGGNFSVNFSADKGDILFGTESTDIPVVMSSDFSVTKDGSPFNANVDVKVSHVGNVVTSGWPVNGYFKLPQNGGTTINISTSLQNNPAGRYVVVLNQVHYSAGQIVDDVVHGSKKSAAPSNKTTAISGNNSYTVEIR